MSTSKPQWFIRNQATQQRVDGTVYESQAKAEAAITQILSEARRERPQKPSPCLEAVQILMG